MRISDWSSDVCSSDLFLPDIAVRHHLLQSVGDVRAEIVAALGEFADREFLLADVEEDQGLDVVDVVDAERIEFRLDHVEKLPVQTLDQRNGFEICLQHDALVPIRPLRGGRGIDPIFRSRSLKSAECARYPGSFAAPY